MENGLITVSISDIQIVAFGNPSKNDNSFNLLSKSKLLGAKTNFLTCKNNESFSNFNHGAIDWRKMTNGIHWLVNSTETILSGISPRSALGAGMTFGELEGARMVMVVDVPDNSEDLGKAWGFVINRIRQIHVLFLTSEALFAISKLEGVGVEDLLKEIRNRGLVPHVCSYIADERRALVEHSLGSIDVVTNDTLEPLEWLARFICNLPLSESGNSGVKSACLS
ncbi:hypothetical protein OAO86_00400 [Euryarchaeota archaeon]|nr:hypothetical protein [Euryarchaeota archaeon]MDC0623572.1 hypothetical protein [Euryarchaeota archaeon]